MRPLVLTLAAAAALALAAPAGALIVVQKSIAGVKLGMSKKQVKAVLGKPKKITHPHNEIEGTITIYKYGLTKVSFGPGKHGKVELVSTRSKKQKTANGVGVGSSEAQLHLKITGIKCETTSGVRSCHVGSFKPGHRVTNFFLKAGKVSRVDLGLVID